MEEVVAPSKFYSLLAAGRPVAAICEPHSYLRQILDEAGCGVGIDIGDAHRLTEYIRYLIKSPEQVASMGSAGRAYCSTHFTLKTVGQQYSQLLHTALGREFQLSSDRYMSSEHSTPSKSTL
jgi:glycosyltransferase involved in cell wall biosynthesis